MGRGLTVVVVAIVILGIVAGLAYALTRSSPSGASTITDSQTLTTQSIYTITGQIQCAKFNITTIATPATSSRSVSASSVGATVPSLNMTVSQGDGVCLVLNIDSSTVSGVVVTAPGSFLLASLPPQFHGQAYGSSMNYTSGVTYTGGPFRFTFIFGASQVGTFNIVVTQANTTEARVSVSVN